MTSRRSPDEVSLVPAARRVPFVAGDTPAMREWAEQLVARARAEGVDLTGDDGLLTAMVRQVLQTGLEVELADHLGYEPHDPAGRGSGSSRNGTSRKTVTTDVGDVELRVPRDRNGTFDPQTVPKHQRRLDGLTGNVISLYAKGMSMGDIQAHLLEIYGTDISREMLAVVGVVQAAGRYSSMSPLQVWCCRIGRPGRYSMTSALAGARWPRLRWGRCVL